MGAPAQRDGTGAPPGRSRGATGGGVIEVHVREPDQLFDTMDPSPFHEKDLDRNAHDYIVEVAEELRRKAPTTLVVYLDEPSGLPDEERLIGKAIRVYFARRAESARQQLRLLLGRGWISLLIGLTVLAGALTTGELLDHRVGGRVSKVLGASLHIGGWVAMWAPMEVFLYDWWPIVGRRRLYERLAGMEVRVVPHSIDHEASQKHVASQQA